MRLWRFTRAALASLLTPALLAACASTAQFERMMESHVGSPIGEIQRQFGYNYIERELPDGQRAYTWTWVEKGMLPGYETPTTIQTYTSKKGQQVVIIPGTYFPPHYYETSCEFSFVTDAGGKVLSWRAHGNGCASLHGPGRVIESGKSR